MNELTAKKFEPDPGTAALAIAAMALMVAGVLQFLGPVKLIDALSTSGLAGLGLEGEMRPLAGWVCWVWTVLATVGVCHALLLVNDRWQRVVIGLSALALTMAWVPVLALAAYQSPIGVPLVALLWGTIGTVIYAERHRGSH